MLTIDNLLETARGDSDFHGEIDSTYSVNAIVESLHAFALQVFPIVSASCFDSFVQLIHRPVVCLLRHVSFSPWLFLLLCPPSQFAPHLWGRVHLLITHDVPFAAAPFPCDSARLFLLLRNALAIAIDSVSTALHSPPLALSTPLSDEAPSSAQRPLIRIHLARALAVSNAEAADALPFAPSSSALPSAPSDSTARHQLVISIQHTGRQSSVYSADVAAFDSAHSTASAHASVSANLIDAHAEADTDSTGSAAARAALVSITRRLCGALEVLPSNSAAANSGTNVRFTMPLDAVASVAFGATASVAAAAASAPVSGGDGTATNAAATAADLRADLLVISRSKSASPSPPSRSRGASSSFSSPLSPLPISLAGCAPLRVGIHCAHAGLRNSLEAAIAARAAVVAHIGTHGGAHARGANANANDAAIDCVAAIRDAGAFCFCVCRWFMNVSALMVVL